MHPFALVKKKRKNWPQAGEQMLRLKAKRIYSCVQHAGQHNHSFQNPYFIMALSYITHTRLV